LRISSLIFVSFVCAGTILVALGPVVFTMRKAWIMMVIGRICLGFVLSCNRLLNNTNLIEFALCCAK
jgi:hypothetical protein